LHVRHLLFIATTSSSGNRGELTRDLLPPAVAPNPDDERAISTPLQCLAAELAAEGEERRAQDDIPVRLIVLLLGSMGHGVDGRPTGAQIGESVGTCETLAARVDEDYSGAKNCRTAATSARRNATS
jgi:hypothetical protein